MKKAAQKTTAPVSLGIKRNCPKCGTKFYDFNKEEPVCPKCENKLDPTAAAPVARIQPEPKKVTKQEKEAGEEAVLATEEVALDDSDGFESVEDLDDEDEDIVEDIDVDDEENETY